MHIQKITFDRVFSVYPKVWKSGEWTEFGFQADGKTVYDARVEGHPDVLAGVPLGLALPKPDAWTRIYGWANLRTGEVVVHERRPSNIVVSLIFMIAFNVFQLPYVLSWASKPLGFKVFMVLTGLAVNAMLVWWALKTVRQITAYRRLVAFVEAGKD